MKPIKIALADDHAMLRKSLRLVIDSMKAFEVVADVDNGKQLLEYLKEIETLPDICVLDINMPEMNGYDTANAISEQFPDIKILALSMYDNEANIIKMLRSGASGYLLKDAEPSELKTALEEIHKHGFYHSGVVTQHLLKSMDENNELNENEMEFLKLCCTELTYKEIAEKMFKSPRTIDGYRDILFTKLNLSSRSGLVLYAIRTGLVSFK